MTVCVSYKVKELYTVFLCFLFKININTVNPLPLDQDAFFYSLKKMQTKHSAMKG